MTVSADSDLSSLPSVEDVRAAYHELLHRLNDDISDAERSVECAAFLQYAQKSGQRTVDVSRREQLIDMMKFISLVNKGTSGETLLYYAPDAAVSREMIPEEQKLHQRATAQQIIRLAKSASFEPSIISQLTKIVASYLKA